MRVDGTRRDQEVRGELVRFIFRITTVTWTGRIMKQQMTEFVG